MVFHSSAKSRGKSALLLMGAAFTLTFAIGTSSSDGLVQSAFNDALSQPASLGDALQTIGADRISSARRVLA